MPAALPPKSMEPGPDSRSRRGAGLEAVMIAALVVVLALGAGGWAFWAYRVAPFKPPKPLAVPTPIATANFGDGSSLVVFDISDAAITMGILTASPGGNSSSHSITRQMTGVWEGRAKPGDRIALGFVIPPPPNSYFVTVARPDK